MQKSVFLDTNVLFEIFKKNEKVADEVWEYQKKEIKICISSVTLFEYFRGCTMGQVDYNKRIVNLMQVLAIFDIDTCDFDDKVANVCARVYDIMKKGGKDIKDRELDFLMAGTAIAKKSPFCTTNEKHFKDIPFLQLVIIK